MFIKVNKTNVENDMHRIVGNMATSAQGVIDVLYEEGIGRCFVIQVGDQTAIGATLVRETG